MCRFGRVAVEAVLVAARAVVAPVVASVAAVIAVADLRAAASASGGQTVAASVRPSKAECRRRVRAGWHLVRSLVAPAARVAHVRSLAAQVVRARRSTRAAPVVRVARVRSLVAPAVRVDPAHRSAAAPVDRAVRVRWVLAVLVARRR
jgi:hypothetical protein